MIPLAILDLDGTMIDASGQVDGRVWEAAERARDAGVRLAVCTGRPGFGVAARIARRLDPDTPHIFQNGAQITYLDGDTLQMSGLREDAAKQLVRKARELGVVLELYTPDTMYVERRTKMSEAHAQMIGVNAIVRDLAAVASEEPIVRAQWVVGSDRLDEVLACTVDGVRAHVASSPVLPDTFFVSLTRGGVDKGSAVRFLADKLEIDLAKVMAVGDSPGDLAMLEAVGHPRVMASGDPELVARFAGHVLPGVADQGAAEALTEAISLRAAPLGVASEAPAAKR
jgi:Cof subfamily protein (haloacid dehalogenase superfamily)